MRVRFTLGGGEAIIEGRVKSLITGRHVGYFGRQGEKHIERFPN